MAVWAGQNDQEEAMTAPAPCPDCDGRGFNYSDPDHRKIICTSCDGPEDGEEEKMSKQGPFDKAIEILKWALDNSLASQASPETAHQCKSLASAIRVLTDYHRWAKLIEAAGKLNKAHATEWLNLADVKSDDMPKGYDPLAFWMRHDKLAILRIIESIPDAKDNRHG
jgi:hypothetical protein